MALPIAGMIGGALLSLAGSFVLRVLMALGLSVVSYYGFSAGLDFFKNLVTSNLSGLPADMLSLLGYMKVGKALTIIFSAMLASVVVKGLSNGVYKRFVLN